MYLTLNKGKRAFEVNRFNCILRKSVGSEADNKKCQFNRNVSGRKRRNKRNADERSRKNLEKLGNNEAGNVFSRRVAMASDEPK